MMSRGIEPAPSIWPRAAAIVVMSLVLIVVGYRLPWTGFGAAVDQSGEFHPAKTLWDWMGLLVVPFLLAILAVQFSRAQKEREIAISSFERGSAALQHHLAYMSDLLVRDDPPDSEIAVSVSRVARARTIATLDMLTPTQKGHLVRFLVELGLIEAESPFISLDRANLRGMYLDPGSYRESQFHAVNLDDASISYCSFSNSDLSSSTMQGADLGNTDFSRCDMNYIHARKAFVAHANLSEARLIKADFGEADLQRANLKSASLRSASFRSANLRGADLEGAHLSFVDFSVADLRDTNCRGADLTGANLYGAKLNGADLTDADLSHAFVSARQLRKAGSLSNTKLPDDE